MTTSFPGRASHHLSYVITLLTVFGREPVATATVQIPAESFNLLVTLYVMDRLEQQQQATQLSPYYAARERSLLELEAKNSYFKLFCSAIPAIIGLVVGIGLLLGLLYLIFVYPRE